MTVQDQFTFITRDFRSAWESLAKQPETVADGRCNFLFANHAMVFLEWCVGVAAKNETGCPGTSLKFRTALFSRTAYHVSLPYPKLTGKLFKKPFFVGFEDSLCAIVFDTVRNGIAHTYYPKALPLTHLTSPTSTFVVSMTGVGTEAPDFEPPSCPHLSWYENGPNVGIWFHPGVAFTDIEKAAKAAGIDALPEEDRFDEAPLDHGALLIALKTLSKSSAPSP